MLRAIRSVVAALAVSANVLVGGAPPASATEFGLSDQQAATWSDSRVRALGLNHARLIVPWDAATSEPARVQGWLDAVWAAGLEPHIVFEHLRSDACPGTPCVVPSRAQYRAAVDAFVARWPQVTTFTTWNETNHFTQPVAERPEVVAGYWAELTEACPGCTIVAADILDSGRYVGWLERFKAATPTIPRRWGLHNYADATYGTTVGTDRVLATVPGEVWVEETGGIVTLRGRDGQVTFPTNERRAATSIDHAFAIARTRPRITRMYVYHWKAHTFGDFFDAGLVRPDGTTRPSYTRFAANLLAWSSNAAARSPQATVTARWSKGKRPGLMVTVRCRAAGERCRGTVGVVGESRRSGAVRSVQLAKRRPYRTSRGRRSHTILIDVPTRIRERMRAASTRRLAISVSATAPAQATADTAIRLGRPPTG